MTAPVLECRDVAKSFGGIRALRGVSLEASAGEVVGVVGGNGAGKSTLLNVISGLHKPDRGEIRLGGDRIEGMAPSSICRLGLGRTFQSVRIFASLTAYQQVCLAASYARMGRLRFRFGREARARALEALELVGLRDAASRQGGDLSVFEQKRLMLATAIAHRPRVFLIDEPASALTPGEIAETARLLLSLRDQNSMAIVLVEHVMGFIRQTADRVIVLHEGENLFSGQLVEVVADPSVRAAWLGETPSGAGQTMLKS